MSKIIRQTPPPRKRNDTWWPISASQALWPRCPTR